MLLICNCSSKHCAWFELAWLMDVAKGVMQGDRCPQG